MEFLGVLVPIICTIRVLAKLVAISKSMLYSLGKSAPTKFRPKDMRETVFKIACMIFWISNFHLKRALQYDCF